MIGLISYPRSGQHLTESVLKYYHEEMDVPFTYCEYYGCCKTLPCSKDSKFQKNHDFWLINNWGNAEPEKLQILDENKYIVLYRGDMISQLEAHYRFDTNKDWDFYRCMKFIQNNRQYYKSFVSKWVTPKKDNILSFQFEDLVKNPNQEYQKMMRFIYPDFTTNGDLNEVELFVDNGSRKRVKRKIEYKSSLSKEMYKKIKETLDTLGLKLDMGEPMYKLRDE